MELETFVRKTFLEVKPSSYSLKLAEDLEFLADIKKRCFFPTMKWRSNVYSLYSISLLIKEGRSYDKLYVQNGSALSIASICGYTDVVVLLLKHKANVHYQKDICIRSASKKGHRDVVKLLLDYKADVHAVRKLRKNKGNEKGHKDVVNLLLDYKADVHALSYIVGMM